MTFKGFFELLTVKDLFAKLERDSVRIQNNPLDVDAAFDFFVTAYHMLDWLHPGPGNSHKRKEIEDHSVLLQVTSHLANGSKHFEATASKHKSVAKTVSRPGGFQPGAFQANAFDVGELVVHLEGDVAADLGTSISVVELARRLVAFWQQKLE
jgi:hypothetical protein